MPDESGDPIQDPVHDKPDVFGARVGAVSAKTMVMKLISCLI